MPTYHVNYQSQTPRKAHVGDTVNVLLPAHIGHVATVTQYDLANHKTLPYRLACDCGATVRAAAQGIEVRG